MTESYWWRCLFVSNSCLSYTSNFLHLRVCHTVNYTAPPPPHSAPPLTCGSATLRSMGTPHLNFLFLRWVRHFLHSTTSQLLEMSPVSEAHCTYIRLSLQNLANLGLLHHEIFAFAEFWQVTYQKLLQISGIKPFRGSFPVELFWWRNLGAWNRFLERHLHSII